MTINVENLNQYLHTLLSAQGDLVAIGPELMLCATIVVMLLARTFITTTFHAGYLAMTGAALALILALGQWEAADPAALPSRDIFDGMLVYDMFTVYLRLFLLTFSVLVIVLTMLTGIPDVEDSADFYTLLLGSVLGMSMMASANNLLMVFLGVEMASVPSYAMAGFLKGRRKSSEAALKYVVYGGASAGVMLYGISLLAGLYGTVHLPTLAHAMLYQFSAEGAAFDPTLLLALMLVFVGIAFKLAAVPFHFWCPDVFEGAAAEVAAFLSVASKGAAVALLARFTMTLAGNFPTAPFSAEVFQASATAMAGYVAPTIAVLAAITATFGNLAAYGQTNLKRMLAYSTIAHAGYMMMALAPMTTDGTKAALVYLFVYLFMNLGAFAVVAFIRNQTGSEDLKTYAGLIHRAPFLTVAMCVFLVSLVGLPPMAGFIGKLQIFVALYKSGWYSLLVIGGVNTVISLVYYVNVMRVMIISGEPSRGASLENGPSAVYATALAAVILYFGIFWNMPEAIATRGASALVNRSVAQEAVAGASEKDSSKQNGLVIANQPIRPDEKGNHE